MTTDHHSSPAAAAARPRGRPRKREKLAVSIPASAPEVPDEILTTKGVADLLKMSVAWVNKARQVGGGPPFKCVGRAVRYSRNEVLGWWKAQPTRH